MRLCNKRALATLTCFFGSIISVAFLQLIAVSGNSHSNYFIRLFIPHAFDQSTTTSLDKDGYYIAGITRDAIFLGNPLNQTSITIVTRKSKEIINYEINIPASVKKELSSLHLSIDSPDLIINNFITGTVLKGDITSPTKELMILDTPYFSTSIFIPYSANSFAIRTYNSHLKKNVLGKLSVDTPYRTFWPQLLEEQNEGVFSTDGMLRYDPFTKSFVYIYFYRNLFIKMNNEFELEYKSRTIDTNTYAKIKVNSIKTQDESTIASPEFYVNRQACVNNKWIIINSGLKADNENQKTFNGFSVIDMYDLRNGQYHFSFYIPKKTGNVTSMMIYDNILYTIQNRCLYSYSLNLNQVKI